MALETLIEKLIVSLDANTAAHKGTAPAAASGKATAATGKPAAVDFELVKKAASEVKTKSGAPVAKKIIKDAGKADSLNAVKPENYAAMLAAFTKALEADADEAEAEEEDL